MKQVKISVSKGGAFSVETEGFVGTLCKQTASELVQSLNGVNVAKDEDRDCSSGDLEMYLNV